MLYRLKFYYYMNHIQSNIYKILPIDNNKLIIYIYYFKPILMFIIVKMDVVLCDNKYILTHSMN